MPVSKAARAQLRTQSASGCEFKTQSLGGCGYAIALLFMALSAVACSSSTGAESSDLSESATPTQDKTATVTRALAELDRQMDAYSPYYDESPDGRRQNGARIAGCWANPAGSDLSDVQKAFYCSMPLEFRICNTVVLLSTKTTKDVDSRYQGYLNCQAKVAGVLSDSTFEYSADVDQAYRKVFLEQDASWTPASMVSDKRPDAFDPFPVLLGRIVDSLVEEGTDLGNDTVLGWADEVKKSGGA
jgi:hypothetical protein